MRYVQYACLGIIAAAVILAAAQVFIIWQHIRKMPYDLKGFVRENPNARLRFLFMGDSTAVGTGALNNTESVAGYFSQAFYF